MNFCCDFGFEGGILGVCGDVIVYDWVRISWVRKMVVFVEGVGIDIDRRIIEDIENYFIVNDGFNIVMKDFENLWFW